jgi:hypothetical protein
MAGSSCLSTWRAYNNGTGYLNSSGTGGLYFNWDSGTGGTNFGNGANGVVASVNSSGKGTFDGGVVVGNFRQSGKALCQKADKSIGYCSSSVDAAGACTCN